ncbi:hypothetical protein GH714_036516 [Hevea brasiliensis]|uniref:Anthocyanidin 3-O-glucosyltransferase n=1 Tax=Hevea brasiliensis TaxID=3981 RepID=A0A6A6L7C1_HEVBR|nr:hypothetical protein GH714_036516 [Hevea brasiliensis]
MLWLANILYSKGFSIIIVHTKFNSPNPSKYPHFTFHSIPDGSLEGEASTADVEDLVTLLNVKCTRSFRDSLVKLLLDVKEEPIACLITDADWYFTQAVADSLKLPRLVLRTSNISFFLVFGALPLLLEKRYIPIKEINEAEFLEIAWGLANSNQPFLWVVRPRLVRGSEWIEPLPDGFQERLGGIGHIVKWAPQKEVLAHPAIGGFWTHNGWNSTLESICEGVPMICHPISGDQKVNARYVTDIWRIGLHLEKKLERGEIERAVKRLIVEADGQEMRKRIMSLKEKVEICLKQGGSSYDSLERLTDYILLLQPLRSH